MDSSSKITEQTANAEARMLNDSCVPPLKLTAVHAALKSAYSRKPTASRKYEKVRDQTIADWLDVTPHEVSICNVRRQQLVLNSNGDVPAAKPKRMEEDTARITARHAAMIKIIAEAHRHVPSSRKMAEALIARGFAVARMTVAKDYKCLGLKTSSSKANKAASNSPSLLLTASEVVNN